MLPCQLVNIDRLCIYCIHPFSHKCDIGHYIYKLHYILNISVEELAASVFSIVLVLLWILGLDGLMILKLL